MASILINRAAAEDLDKILALAERNYAENGGELTGRIDREGLRRNIESIPSVVARAGDLIIGFLLTSEKGASSHPAIQAMLNAYSGSNDAYIYGPICVDASFRGSGLARAMFAELCRQIPGREGILFIKAGNRPSLRAHEKMGMGKTAEFEYEGSMMLVFAYGPQNV
jgi:ribosomal protein S18 acetylase RimI-like enzyme